MSKITLNIIEHGNPAPVDPSGGSVNTGLFTHGIGAPEAAIMLGAVLFLVILSLVLANYTYKKHKKAGKTTRLVHLVERLKTVLKNKKQVFAGLAAIAVVVTISSSTAFMQNTDGDDEETAEGGLALSVSDTDFTIEIDDEPVFAVMPVEVTVEEATEAGYTLTAYANNTSLVSTTNDSNIIPMVTMDEDELAALAENSYGLSLTEPESKDSNVYMSLSTNSSEPTIITDKDYEATEANDTVTLYYGFYVVPGVQAGTYQSSGIKYKATANRSDLAIINFDGNGLYYNGDETQTINKVRYDANAITPFTEKYSYTQNLDEGGTVINPSYPDNMYPVDTSETFVYDFPGADKVKVDIVKTDNDSCPYNQNAYLSFWAGNHPEYTALDSYGSAIRAFGNTTGKYVFGNYRNQQTYVDGDTVTLAYYVGPRTGGRGCNSGYGYYTILTGYDADGNPVHIRGNEVVAGKYKLPSSEEYSHFLGWSEDKDATEPTYKTEKDLATKLSLDPNQTITLYAVWEQAFTISYKGNGADDTTNMNSIEQFTTDLESKSKQVDLFAPNFTKQGHGFVGWSADKKAWDKLTDDDDSNDPVIYGPNQTITVNPSTSTKLVLYAIWAPAETTESGNYVTLQEWQGCSALTPTTYDEVTKTLSVGKNTVTALTDSRDGNVYMVARLADGNCWMTENLRLDNSIANEATTSEFSAANTNNPSLPLKNDYAGQVLSNRLSASSKSWCNENTEECINQSVIDSINTTERTASPIFSQDFTEDPHNFRNGHLNANLAAYGNYYNWYSTTAGNGVFTTGERGTEIAAGDICPTGWNLPIGIQANNNGSFHHLDTVMGNTGANYQGSIEASNKWRSFPNNFVYSGLRTDSSATNRGYGGEYWSSTTRVILTGHEATNSAYILDFGSNYVQLGYYHSKRSGNAVRCLATVQTTLHFDANEGEIGKMTDQGIAVNVTTPISANQFAKAGYRFAGWNTERDGSGTSYADKEEFTATESGKTITLYAQWEEGFDDVFYIVYDGNGADAGTDMENVEQYTADTTSGNKEVDLIAPNFSKQGYGFVGWSTDQNAWDHLIDNDDSNDPIIYGPNETVTVDPSIVNDLKLYAVWAPAETTPSGDPVTLQNWQGCSALTPTTYDINTNTLSVGKNTVTVLTDSRDGEAYTIARLADGNCWMTENLRLDDNPELSQQNTNNPALPLTNNSAEQITSNKLTASSLSDWCNVYPATAACVNQSMLNTKNTTAVDASPIYSQDFTSARRPRDYLFDYNIKAYGNYYNWYSATAGNGTYEKNDNEVASGDICPTGWHLPYGGYKTTEKGGNTSGGFYYLTQLMNNGNSSDTSNHWRSFPNNIVYSGYISNSQIWIRDREGDYWSATARYNGSANMMGVSSSYVSPDNNYEEMRGFAVRCVAY